MSEEDLVAQAEGALLLRGFAVRRNARVQGLSGYTHEFSLLAERGARRFLIDFARELRDVLAFIAKTVDVRGYSTVLAVGGELAAKIGPLGVCANVIVYKDAEDLERKLVEALGG